jgi:hypothetical protein
MGQALAGPLGGAVGGIGATLIGSPSKSGTTTTSGTTSGTQSGESSGTSGGTTSSNQTGTNLGITNWNLSPEFQSMQNNIPSQYRQLMYNASKPLLGQAQQTAYMGNLNQGYNQATQGLMSQLAKRGALNSGSAGAAMAGLAQGKMGQQSQYLAQAPVTNQQNSNSLMASLLSQGMGYKPMAGQTTYGQSQNTTLTDIANYINSIFNQSSSGTTNSTETQKQNATGLLGALGL